MNLTRYQDPNYIAGWSPMDLRVIQQNIQGRQKRYDDIMQKYADTQALLNDSEVYDVQSATELRNKFEEGFDRLFDATGGDFVTYHNDAYRYLANAKADPAYGLLKQHAEAYKNFLKRKEQAGETGLVFKEMPERIVDENGYYRDPSEFTFKVDPMENWGGTQSELAGRAMQQTGWESEFRNLGNGYLESITQTGVRDLDQVLGNISKGLPGKVNQLLQNYIETTAGQQQLAWYEKGMEPEKALDKIKRELVSAAALYATKGTSNRTRVQDVDYQTSPYGTGVGTGTGTFTYMPGLPGSQVERGGEYDFYNKDAGLSPEEAAGKWNEKRNTAKGLVAEAAYPITDVLFPGVTLYGDVRKDNSFEKGRQNRAVIAAGELAKAYGSEKQSKYFYDIYKAKASSPMNYSDFKIRLANISRAYDDLSRINYYSVRKPSKITTETGEYAFVKALTLNNMTTAEAQKERDRVMNELFTRSRLMLAGQNGGFTGYAVEDTDSDNPKDATVKYRLNGKIANTRDLIKGYFANNDFKVENIGMTDAPYDKDKNGDYVQSVVLTLSGQTAESTTGNKTMKTLKVRIPVSQIDDPVFRTTQYSFRNKLHTALNRPTYEMGLTDYSIKETSPSTFERIKELRGGNKIHDIVVKRNKNVGGDYSDEVTFLDKDGKVLGKESGTEFLYTTDQAYNEYELMQQMAERAATAEYLKKLEQEARQDPNS